MTEHESLVMRYVQAWYSQDFATMRRCLADDVRFDMGRGPSFQDADEFMEFCRDAPTFRDVMLLENVVHGDRAALMFEGIFAESGARTRAALFLRLEAGKICAISMATAPLDDRPDMAPTLRNPFAAPLHPYEHLS